MGTRERRRHPMALWPPVVIAWGMIWGGWKWWELRNDRRAYAAIRGDIQAGRPGHAVKKLTAILSRKPDSDEAIYLLGTCEKARGRAEVAAEVWSRIQPGSQFTAQAIQGRMEVEIQRGRLSGAERLLKQAMEDPRIDGAGLPVFLGLVYCQQGRVTEAEQLIEAAWDRLDASGDGHSERAIVLLLLHIRLRLEPIPEEAVRAYLAQAARLAPEDDRVWLARANLAIRARKYDEAKRWLDGCLHQRPEDPAVSRSWLSWAMAVNQLAVVREAAARIPGTDSTPALVARVARWLAARRGDVEAERRALERLLEADPTDFQALDRLTELAVQAGQPDRAESLLRQKAGLQQVQDRYQFLYRRNQPARDAVEMAHLAEQLGQRFEARAFLTMAVFDNPQRGDLRSQLARFKEVDRSTVRSGLTLADSPAVELDGTATGLPGKR